MPSYLKVEQPLSESNVSIQDDLMGVSMLSLALSPWAMIGLSLYYFSSGFMTLNLAIGCGFVVLMALPKTFELLLSRRDHYSVTH